MRLHTSRRQACIGLIGLTLAASAWAFPDKPVRLVVPFAPGGGTDLIARSLGQGMSQELGQPVIIENRAGAGTTIGSDFVAKSPADGYTLLVATFAHAINPSLLSKLPYDTSKAFTPVSLIAKGPNVLLVRTNSPFRSVAEVIAAAKAAPDKLTYASQGNGTSAHLAGEMFANLGKVKLTHIPYRGAGPALTDLLGGQVDMMFATAAAASAQIAGGKLKALAITSEQASNAFPGVATLNKTVDSYSVESWYGIYAPAGTPPAVIEKLNAAIKKAVRFPEFVKKTEPEGLSIVSSEPAELDRYVKAEEARWSRIVRENNIKAD
ncbi:MAG: tripartite tricarboxylate transporter substrate binding protein [Brachymonas sp.]|nr:tripartite tricarboxylate transporter substrate binding protein [Brachymonas sp.]